MKPCRQLVVEAVLALVETIAAQEQMGGVVKAVTVELNRRTALEERDLPSAILYEADEIPLNDFSTMDLYELGLVVQVAALGSGGVAVEFVNSMRAEVIKALKSDISLGGLVRWLELRDAGDFIAAEIPAQAEGALLSFLVHYATREGDPYTFEHNYP